VTDSDIAGRYDMKKEPSDKLVGLEGHGFLTVMVCIIAPEEGDLAVLDGEDTVITDGDSMGIPAEVLKGPLGAIEGGFAIDDPLFMVERSSEGFEGCRIFEIAEAAGEDQVPSFEAILEEVKELAFEQCRHNPHGEEEPFAAGDPAAAVRREAASGDDAVEVGMIHEVLTPGMENFDHSHLCAEMFWVLGEFGECLGCAVKKQVVQDLLVHGNQGIQF
jgi:hypothetical protein